MTKLDRLHAKALTLSERSDGIVVSFGADWHDALMAKDFSVVIRKRVPSEKSFKWLYFHVNSPIGAVCGRAAIKNIFGVTVDDAIKLWKEIKLSPADIAQYMEGCTEVGCYRLGSIQLAAQPVRTDELMKRMVYYPPQSFFVLSKGGKDVVDEMARFRSSHGVNTRRGRAG